MRIVDSLNAFSGSPRSLSIFGPDRLPKAIADGVKFLQNLRRMARNATSDLSKDLGTDIQIEDLNPRTFLRKHVLSEEDEAAIRRPLEGLLSDVKDTARDLDVRKDITAPVAAAPAVEDKPAAKRTFDLDAT